MTPERFLTQSFLSEMCPVLSFAPDSNLFFLDDGRDKALAFGFVGHPMTGADQASADRLGLFLNQDFPKGTLVQVCLHAGPDIQGALARYSSARDGGQINGHAKKSTVDQEFLAALTQRQVDFFKSGIDSTIMPSDAIRPRDIRIFVTVRLPISATLPSEVEMLNADRRAKACGQILSNSNLPVVPLTPDLYIRFMASVLNADKQSAWRTDHIPYYDKEIPINEQIADPGAFVEHTKDGLTIGDKRVKIVSVKRYPDQVYFGHAIQYLGDMMTGTRGIRDYCIISLNVSYQDAETERSKIEMEGTWVTNQAYGPLLKFVPRLAKQKQSFDAMNATLAEGDRTVRAYLSLALFTDAANEAQSVANAVSYWRECGLIAMEDRFACLPLFLNSLPLCADPRAIPQLMRYKRMASRHATAFMPLFGDWKGSAHRPPLMFLSRKGQLMGCDVFGTNSSYNSLVCAESGAGKSFFVNELLLSYLSVGGRVWVIDVGRSYEKLCKRIGGQYLEFSASSKICINPFSLVKDYDEEADVLLGIVMAMAFPTQPPNDFQISALRRTLNEVWTVHGTKTTVDAIAQALTASDDLRVRDLGSQLYAFSSQGEYGRFFNGENNIRLDAELVLTELEELKSRKHLQRVVLLQLLYQIQQEMYLGDRGRRKMVIVDEAWDLLTEGTEVAGFLVGAYRRFRKYGGAACVITQSLEDVYLSPGGQAIAANSPNLFLLRQKAETIDRIREKKYLSMPDGAYDLLKTVHTIKGQYSELFVMQEGSMGIGRLIVPPYKRLLYTTDASEVAAINKLTAAGYTLDQAIMTLIDRGRAA